MILRRFLIFAFSASNSVLINTFYSTATLCGCPAGCPACYIDTWALCTNNAAANTDGHYSKEYHVIKAEFYNSLMITCFYNLEIQIFLITKGKK